MNEMKLTGSALLPKRLEPLENFKLSAPDSIKSDPPTDRKCPIEVL
ncbi:hypothetical protein [Sphingobacterium sp. JB170]|nr:hypothetical protein [Sphingobacterium sp. JB170]